tara:strand:+ start:1013 stop:1399 length:387 start_codon:yes stop_codon:yes gene_type:complete
MQVEISFEYVLEFCVSEELCETLNIELPDNFLLESIELNAEKSSLSHLCSCNIKIDGVSAYSGPIGNEGFVMEIDTIMPISELNIATDCGSLSDVLNQIEPCIVNVKGHYQIDEQNIALTKVFTDKWA